MGKITAGVATSHVPAIGAAIDNGKTQQDHWKPVFAGYEWTRKWMEGEKPDVVILVYNDHATSMMLDVVPTFALGCASSFQPADEGWGPRPVPVVQGHPDLAAHLFESLVEQEFDITAMHRMEVDHGLTVPLSLMFGQPTHWPVRVIPLAVNVVQYPPPTPNRLWNLGEALARAVESFPDDIQVQVWGTGGLSHQLQGERAGLINQVFDQAFLRDLSVDPQRLRNMKSVDYLRETGSEGMEMTMWLTMRAALGAHVSELHRFYHVPASNTAVGHLVLKPALQK